MPEPTQHEHADDGDQGEQEEADDVAAGRGLTVSMTIGGKKPPRPHDLSVEATLAQD